MVIFSHRGIGFGKSENSVEAFTEAIGKGFSVEVDLRLVKNSIALSHDLTNKKYVSSEFIGLLKLIKDNPKAYFALHIKENSQKLFKKVSDSIREFTNCFVFATDFSQDELILGNYIDSAHLALYVTGEVIDKKIIEKVDYLWIDETRARAYDKLDLFLSFNKKIICCSPELYLSNVSENDIKYLENIIRIKSMFGICTDFTNKFLTRNKAIVS